MTYTTDAVTSRRGEGPGAAAKKRVVSGGLSMRTRAARRRPTVPGTGELVWFAMCVGCGDHFWAEAWDVGSFFARRLERQQVVISGMLVPAC